MVVVVAPVDSDMMRWDVRAAQPRAVPRHVDQQRLWQRDHQALDRDRHGRPHRHRAALEHAAALGAAHVRRRGARVRPRRRRVRERPRRAAAAAQAQAQAYGHGPTVTLRYKEHEHHTY